MLPSALLINKQVSAKYRVNSKENRTFEQIHDCSSTQHIF